MFKLILLVVPFDEESGRRLYINIVPTTSEIIKCSCLLHFKNSIVEVPFIFEFKQKFLFHLCLVRNLKLPQTNLLDHCVIILMILNSKSSSLTVYYNILLAEQFRSSQHACAGQAHVCLSKHVHSKVKRHCSLTLIRYVSLETTGFSGTNENI